MKKKKNQTSVMNRYLLIGLSVFCIFMMLLSSFSDKVGERQFPNSETGTRRKYKASETG